MTRLALAAFALLVIAQVAVYSPDALPSMILAAALVAAVFAFEETRVSEARRRRESAEKRVCHHGGTTFQPFDGDDAVRHQVGRRP
jgi:hypothetical protein